MEFLISREAQKELIGKLVWPAMRLDVMGGIPDWQKRYQGVINEALQYAEPLPEHWYPYMPDIYKELFHKIVDSNEDMEGILAEFQAKIDDLMAEKAER